MKERERIEYYGCSDYWFEKSLKVLEQIDENNCDDINDIIEFNNIIKHINDHLPNNDLNTLNNKADYCAMKQKLMRRIGIFCSNFDENNTSAIYDELDYRYIESFWELIDHYKVFEKISVETFEQLLSKKNIQIKNVLLYEKLVKRFDKSIKTFLLSSEIQAVDVIMYRFFIDLPKFKYHMPKSITIDDYNFIFNKYIDSEFANLNTLKQITELPVVEGCVISDEVRAKAQKRYQILLKDFFKKYKGVRFDYNVDITKEISEMDAYKYDSNSVMTSLRISEDWIKNNLDFPTLLNNFIYLLELVDNQFRITLISKITDLDLFERIGFEYKIKDSYLNSSYFEMENSFAIIKMMAYVEFLKKEHNLRIEEVLQWFFDEYLKNEFDINDFNVFLPLEGRTYLEMCRTMCIEIESTIKQFDSYVKYGFVNHKVIEAFSTPMDYGKANSLLSHKYIYPNENKCAHIMRLLFSSQSGLTHLPKKQETYNCFYEMIYKNNITLDDFAEFRSDSLQDLLNLNIIKIDNDNFIRFVEIKEICVLYDLYKNEFAVTSFYDKIGLQKTMESLLNKEWITQESSLFSKQESEYFNYFLNKKVSNGLNLRNIYLHGTQQKNGADEELHKGNYYRLLLIYILMVVKINDELCSVSDINEKSKVK